MKKILILIIVVAVGAFAWWTISPLFIDKVVDDSLDPDIVALLESTAPESVVPEEPVATPTDQAAAEPAVAADPVPEDTEPAPVTAEPIPVPSPEPTTSVTGPFSIIDTPGHNATGDIRVITTPEQTIVRYENYDGTNGPDLKVYLTNDLDARDFVSLGVAKGNQGNINYTVPADVAVTDYQYVVTWCEAFGVLFDYAEIN